MTKKNSLQGKVSDGHDIEFSRELADQDDLEAMERSKAADTRMKSKPPMKNK